MGCQMAISATERNKSWGVWQGDLWMFTFLTRLARKGLRAFENYWKEVTEGEMQVFGENSPFCGLTP